MPVERVDLLVFLIRFQEAVEAGGDGQAFHYLLYDLGFSCSINSSPFIILTLGVDKEEFSGYKTLKL